MCLEFSNPHSQPPPKGTSTYSEALQKLATRYTYLSLKHSEIHKEVDRLEREVLYLKANMPKTLGSNLKKLEDCYFFVNHHIGLIKPPSFNIVPLDSPTSCVNGHNLTTDKERKWHNFFVKKNLALQEACLGEAQLGLEQDLVESRMFNEHGRHSASAFTEHPGVQRVHLE